jgi:hypothetical protein
MRRIILASSMVVAFGAFAPASALVVVSSVEQFSTVASSGVDFNSVAIGSTPTGPYAGDPTATFSAEPSSGGTVVAGSSSGLYAQPAFDATPYLVINANNGERISYSSVRNSFSLLVGSVDTFNTFEFFLGTVSQGLINGDLIAPPADGNQSRSFNVTFTGAFDSVVLRSGTQNALEVDNIAAAVPEASTWAMMILGFLGLGFVGYRKSSKTATSAFRIA